jgi:hypothetical protein
MLAFNPSWKLALLIVTFDTVSAFKTCPPPSPRWTLPMLTTSGLNDGLARS